MKDQSIDRILIVCETFPATAGIGGKRWYNLGKNLANSASVDILTFSKYQDTENQFNNVYSIKSNYPKILQQSDLSLFEKVSYRTHLFWRKLMLEGTPYDSAAQDKKVLQKKLRELQQKNNYQAIISSGAPFSILYNALTLSSHADFNKVIFISDLRDPWTSGSGYGMNTISDKKKNFELTKEKFVLNSSDLVLVPAKKMKHDLKQIYPNASVLTLPHGFDQKKIDKSLSKSTLQVKSEKLKLMYAGTWYNNINQAYSDFITQLDKSSVPYSFEIFTKKNSIKTMPNFEGTDCNEYLEEDDLFRKIKSSDLYIVFFPDRVKDFVSAKFFEIFYIGTPVLLIAKKGYLSDFIIENNLGFHMEPNAINSDNLTSVFTKLKNSTSSTSKNNILKYEFEHLACAFLKHLQTIQ